MSAEYSRQIDGQGIIAGPDWLELPATLYSSTGNFYRTVNNPDELLEFLQDHRATEGAYFCVKSVWAYYCEARGDLIYSASEFHIRSKHDTRNLMGGYEHLY